MRTCIGSSLIDGMDRDKEEILQCLCFLAFAIGNGENRGTTHPILEIDAPAIDFGDVKQHQTLTKRCKLTNRSTSILVIRDLVKSCGCTTAEVTSTEIEPGASVFLDIEWNTRSLRGRNTEVVGINFTKKTDEETMTVTLSLIANVQPSVKSSVDHLEFSIAEPASKSVTFQTRLSHFLGGRNGVAGLGFSR